MWGWFESDGKTGGYKDGTIKSQLHKLDAEKYPELDENTKKKIQLRLLGYLWQKDTSFSVIALSSVVLLPVDVLLIIILDIKKFFMHKDGNGIVNPDERSLRGDSDLDRIKYNGF